MEVRGTPVNIDGRTGGTPGPAPGNASAPTRVPIRYPTGRAPSANATTFARMLTVRNLDGSNALRVYVGDGTYVTIPANTSQPFYGAITWFAVQSNAAGTVQWEATAVVAA